MRRFRRPVSRVEPADSGDARELLDLATRLGIPPEDAARQVSQLINEAKHTDDDPTHVPTAPVT